MDTNRGPATGEGIDLHRLRKAVYGRVMLGFVLFGLVLFLPAGTVRYWQAWVYLLILFAPMMAFMSYLLRQDPELLERRLRMKEKEAEQKTIMTFSVLIFLVVFLIPGFDRRFAWSAAPVAVIVMADVMFVLGYGFFLRVLLENRYASRIVEVQKGQKVIDTGPYAVVRHPMYLAASVMYLFSPLALGSYWGLIAAALIPFALMARILNEEKVLLERLEGYREYTQKTRYRLIPGVW